MLPIGALLLGVALLLLGGGLLNTLLAIRGGLEGYSDSSMGWIMSGYFVGFFIGTFLALPIIQRIGHIRTFAFCAAIAACSVLLHVLLVNPVGWLLLRVVTGSSLVILYTVIESWLNGYTPSEQRGKVFSIYMVVNLGSLALAQQLLRLDSPSAFTLFALGAILVTLSVLPVTWTRLAQPEVSKVSKVKYGDLYRVAPVAMAGALLSGLAMGAFWGMSAVYGRRIGLDSNSVATFISCAIVGGALLQFPLGRYSDTHDRRKVLAVVCCGAALAALLLALLSMAGQWVMLAIALYGGMAFAVYPVCVAHLSDHLDAESMLSGSSGILLLHGVGAAIGPALAGQLMGVLGPQALPIYFVCMQMLLAVFTAVHLRKKVEDPSEHPSHFMPMVRTTPTALEMLPDEEITSAPETASTGS
ncbi:MAG: MFS transporter [Pseudomonadales bacterium]|nr:MFS transporter [Pseudomonadales bacterium]MEC8811876.1 MFS transporter [Pseudomonadota bacterium]RLT88176.1 MAG: MFS transporter [Ketobacter sp. GenoA1]RLT95297.1 MAG: MFS transporter [Ketobacter sp.]TNC90515.1 MAG: MFS transporter [Alcanivorax sp.]HAG96327.1 MFS transporter [Gammaproteobacteria bacterium]